jgi:hypothetical protein
VLQISDFHARTRLPKLLRLSLFGGGIGVRRLHRHVADADLAILDREHAELDGDAHKIADVELASAWMLPLLALCASWYLLAA